MVEQPTPSDQLNTRSDPSPKVLHPASPHPPGDHSAVNRRKGDDVTVTEDGLCGYGKHTWTYFSRSMLQEYFRIMQERINRARPATRVHRQESVTLPPHDQQQHIDNPSNVPDQLFSQLQTLCAAFFPSAASSLFSVTVVKGGITNALFRCSWDQKDVVVRVYGAKTELIIDRLRENRISDILSLAGFGKKILGNFEGGRVEEWLEGRTLSPNEMIDPIISAKIGARLGQMHLVKVDDPLIPKGPTVWETLDKWYEMASEIKFDGPDEVEAAEVFASLDFASLGGELALLKKAVSDSPLVFAHNDLLSGNVFLDSNDCINFIDFEYGAFNPRAFDIANHFCECCGFECDWNQFPTQDQQSIFFQSYLSSCQDQSPSAAEVQALYDEVRPWGLVSHLFWGIWAIVQAKHSPIDFDFIGYSKLRIAGFRQHKPLFLQ